MFRRSLAAVVVVLVVAGFVIGATVNGRITKVEDKKITANVKKDKKDKEGEEKTFTTNDKTEYYQGQGKDKDPKKITLDDLKKAVGDKGVGARIETNDDGVVTKVTTFGGKKK